MKLLTGKGSASPVRSSLYRSYSLFFSISSYCSARCSCMSGRRPKWMSLPFMRSCSWDSRPAPRSSFPLLRPPPETKAGNEEGASAKGGMPGLKKQKAVPEYVAEDEEAGSEKSSKKQEAVAVATPQGFQVSALPCHHPGKDRAELEPPPGAKGIRAKVQFTILRSGLVVEPDIEESSGNFYFDQAALRAIQSSSPFPRLPEEFFQEQVVLSADLMEKE